MAGVEVGYADADPLEAALEERRGRRPDRARFPPLEQVDRAAVERGGRRRGSTRPTTPGRVRTRRPAVVRRVWCAPRRRVRARRRRTRERARSEQLTLTWKMRASSIGPCRAVCADRCRWEHPTRWRPRHLRDRPEMTEPAEARFGLLQARLPVAEPRRGIGIEAGAQRSDPHTRLTQRDRHLVAPPFGRAPSQRGHRAEHAEVPGDVVARRGGVRGAGGRRRLVPPRSRSRTPPSVPTRHAVDHGPASP